MRRLQASLRKMPLDDDGGNLDEDATEVFSSLPKPPFGWDNPDAGLDFKMSSKEQDYLRRKLGLLTRPGDKAPALLAKLVEGRGHYPSPETTLPRELDSHADPDDKTALRIARDAAELSAIGRAVYGALVEHLRTEDGKKDDSIFRAALRSHFDKYEAGASRCDLTALKVLLPTIPAYVNDVLAQTQEYVRGGKPEAFLKLRDSYRYSEVMRKTGRARLANTLKAVQRRSEWEPGRHNITPLQTRRTGTRVELVRAIEALRGRVRILAQSGRVVRSGEQMQILKLLDRFIKTVKMDENENSFHPKAALMRYQNATNRMISSGGFGLEAET